MVKVINFPGVHKKYWGPPSDFGPNVLYDYLAWEAEQIEADNRNEPGSENHQGMSRRFRHYVKMDGKGYWPCNGRLVRRPVWLWKMRKYLSGVFSHE